jgi:hypothetical protein
MKVLEWVRHRHVECALILLGIFLRLTMRWRYDVNWGYDADAHWQYVEWIVWHRALPPVDAMVEAFHPPLFYASIAWLFRHGVSREAMVFVPMACGIARLGLIWAGLEMYLGNQRWAIRSALALAAVLPASVQVDGMVYPEAVSCLLVTGAMIVIPLAFRGPVEKRWWPAITSGLLIGLAMLTKISALAVVAAVGSVALVELVMSRHSAWRDRSVRLLPWLAAAAMVVAVSGWYFARNVRNYRKPFLTSFDLTERARMAEAEKVPYFSRRKAAFLLGWDRALYSSPYYPTASAGDAHFFEVAMASTFLDYYNYSFSGLDPSSQTDLRANGRPVSPRLLTASRRAVVGGTIVLLGAAAGFASGARTVLQRSNWGLLALLLIPFFTALFALHFAVKFPLDTSGVIKGVYMQFGAPPLYATYGLSVAWAQRKKERWPLLAILLSGLWLVASYTLFCRARILILPLS